MDKTIIAVRKSFGRMEAVPTCGTGILPVEKTFPDSYTLNPPKITESAGAAKNTIRIEQIKRLQRILIKTGLKKSIFESLTYRDL